MSVWKQRLVRSLHVSRGHAEARYFQIATVDSEGLPDNRTVVFRGFDQQDPLALLTVTDTRSEKVQHLLERPVVSVAWYFRKTREQYRFRGTAELRVDASCSVDKTATSIVVADVSDVWERLSDAAREQFFWPRPGAPVTDTDGSPKYTPGVSPHFAVLCVTPDDAQYLDLKGKPQVRERYTRTDDGWETEIVNP